MKRRPFPTPAIKSPPLPVKATNGQLNGHMNGNGKPNGLDHTYVPSHTHRPSHLNWLETMSDAYTPAYRSRNDVKYRDHFPEMVFQLRLMGASNRMIANACNVSEVTINDWTNNHHKMIPIFSEAMRRGAELADARVAESMYHRAIGYSHPDEKIVVTRDEGVVAVPIVKHYPPDASAGIFWLTNRQKGLWHNRVTSEMTGPDGQALMPPQLIVQPVSTKE